VQVVKKIGKKPRRWKGKGKSPAGKLAVWFIVIYSTVNWSVCAFCFSIKTMKETAPNYASKGSLIKPQYPARSGNIYRKW
jgi:hypothetical protein